jgi:signal transduction histidine kinase/ligand-binding sensor domain-containing protein
MRKAWALVFAVLLVPLRVRAEQGQWTLYTAADGLDRNLIYDVVQDREGAIWAASKTLNRFDGRRFEHYPGGGPLYLDRSQRLWVGPLDQNVVLLYDELSHTFQTRFSPAEGLPDCHVQAIFEDRAGSFWFGTSKTDGGGVGVARFDGRSFRLYGTADGLSGNDVYSIAQDAQGNLWFALAAYRPGAGKGVARFDGQHFRNFSVADGLPSNEVRCIFEDSRKDLWVGTREGLCRLRGERFESFVSEDGRLGPKAFIERIFEDHAGNLWFGTGTVWFGTGTRFGEGRYRGQGLLRYDGRAVTVFNEGVLSQSPITSITEDRDGNLWMTAFAGGLVKYDPSFYRPKEDEPLLSAGVMDLTVDAEGLVYFATKDGALVRQDGRSFQKLGPESGLPAEKVVGLTLSADKRLWVMTTRSLSRYDGTRFEKVLELGGPIIGAKVSVDGSACAATESEVTCTARTGGGQARTLRRGSELPDALIIDFYEDARGVLWIATQAGLVRASDAGLRTFTTKDGLQSDRIQKNLRDGPDGKLLFLGIDSGLYAIRDDRVVNLGKQYGVDHVKFSALFVDHLGRVWLGAWGRGLYCYDTTGVHQVGENASAFLADLTAIAEDARGQLWLGTSGGGVTRYDGRGFQSLSSKDGLASDNVLSISFGPDGSAWLLHLEETVTRYTPRQSQPTVRVSQAVTDRTYDEPQSLSLTERSLKEIKFDFRGLSFNVRPEAMLYTWRLEGVDKAWVPPSPQQAAVYRDLGPGEYTFEVRAVDRDLNFSRASAVVSLVIELPWYLNRIYSVPLAVVALSFLFALGWTVQQAVVHRQAAKRLRIQLREQEIREKEALAKKNAELEASYRQLELTHGKLAETHTELEHKSNELVRSYAELQKALEELKQTQSQLVHSEKMAALGTMVAGVAHEINNPVNFIHANLPTLQEYVDGMKSLVEAYEEGKPKEEVEELKGEIDYEFLLEDLDELIKGCKTGTERIRQIVLDLRNFSRKDEADLKPVDLHEGVDSSLTILGNLLKGRIQVHKEYGAIPKVPCNAGQINQVVLNLLKNAADAIPGEGQIWVRTRQDGDAVEISVTDTGPGIPPEVMKKIFDPFFTTKPVGKGTGLGLSVSMQIVDRHGGRLWAESEPGKGATFFIRLPLKRSGVGSRESGVGDDQG